MSDNRWFYRADSLVRLGFIRKSAHGPFTESMDDTFETKKGVLIAECKHDRNTCLIHPSAKQTISKAIDKAAREAQKTWRVTHE